MPRVTVALGAIAVSSVLAGCGSTRTVTVNSPPPTMPVATKTVKHAPQPSTRACLAGVTANAHASCPFAARILTAYAALTGEEPAGGPTFGVDSPTTHQHYSVHCSFAGSKRIACRTTDAVVMLSFGAVNKARESNRSSAIPMPAPRAAEAQAQQAENSQRIKRLEESREAERETRRLEEREQECLIHTGVRGC
jgi:hypothetical protein